VDKFRTWYDAAVQADPNKEWGQLEGLFEVWYRALATSTGKSNEQEPNPAAVAAVAEVLDQWNEKHQFRDSERGARLHLLAALVVREQPGDAARKYAAAGLEFKPRDEKVAQLLRVLAEGGGKWQILGSGSGFLVAAGLVLTNNHVIEGPGRLAVRWPGLEEPLEAKVLAKDDQSDLALLRVQPPGDAGPTPLRISPQSIGRGARVAAFGFPLGELVGKELKLTTGVVSSTAAPATNNMILLDCLVNPGNSGGPLCNPKGQVVGVVTARSLSSAQVGSYGMAVPGTIALEFLRKSIPDFDDGSAEPVPEEGEWDEVDQRVSPAVLMVLKIK
jgi:S1-C subfamily serine protease